MTHIVKKQKEVLKRFKRHGENLLGPENPPNERYRVFRDNADSLLDDTDERLEVLKELQNNAEHVCRDVSKPDGCRLLSDLAF